ncbi:MAG: type 1 glutamine amidotransferase [Deltaproteobacteria bacterium]|nr:type 1 glutamine amidotransferase [Deltaproteobacteria bacterium]
MTRVLILDGSIDADIYCPTQGWRNLLGDVPSDSVHLPSGGRVPELKPYTHLIVTGSEASITQWEPWYDVEADVIRRAVKMGKAVFGSCFGHQMLAAALSGRQYTDASATPEHRWIEVELFASDHLFEGLPHVVRMFAAHFDEVRDPPPPWRVLARSKDCAVHAMRYGHSPVWGIQAHPEITPKEARALMEGFVARHPDKARFLARGLAMEPMDDNAAPLIVRRFLESPAG